MNKHHHLHPQAPEQTPFRMHQSLRDSVCPRHQPPSAQSPGSPRQGRFPSHAMRHTKTSFRRQAPAQTGAHEGALPPKALMQPLPSEPAYARGPANGATLGKRSRAPPGPPRFQYVPFHGLDGKRVLQGRPQVSVEVRVASQHISGRNEAVKRRSVWGGARRMAGGARQYTDDSDVVAMLVHSGTVVLPTRGTPGYDSLLVTLSVTPYRRGGGPPFPALNVHGLRSRDWAPSFDGACVAIAKIASVRDGKATELEPQVLAVVPRNIPRLRPYAAPPAGADPREPPFYVDRAVFDLANRPCLVFNILTVADKGTDKSAWPSRRLWREILYIESATARYEIAKVDAPERERDPKERDSGKDKDGGKEKEVAREKRRGLYVRFAQVKKEAVRRDMYDLGPPVIYGPMDPADLVPGYGSQKWTSLRWDPSGVTVNGVHYKIQRVTFRTITKRRDSEKREADKKDAEKKELDKKDSDKSGTEKKESEKKVSEKKVSDKRESERKDGKRRDSKRKDSESRDAKKKDAEMKTSEKNT